EAVVVVPEPPGQAAEISEPDQPVSGSDGMPEQPGEAAEEGGGVVVPEHVADAGSQQGSAEADPVVAVPAEMAPPELPGEPDGVEPLLPPATPPPKVRAPRTRAVRSKVVKDVPPVEVPVPVETQAPEKKPRVYRRRVAKASVEPDGAATT
ncbi:MAG: hypothetical protein HQL88_03215, partial [Magnetococcales bacterium]|nr:hypothetical protein [Magnetococcales bacterium]